MKKNGKLHVNKNYVDIGYEKHTCRQEDSLKLPRSAEGNISACRQELRGLYAYRKYGNCVPTCRRTTCRQEECLKLPSSEGNISACRQEVRKGHADRIDGKGIPTRSPGNFRSTVNSEVHLDRKMQNDTVCCIKDWCVENVTL